MILLHRLAARNFKQLSEVALRFPEQATILIEGHNEAGKSSLFEAVFFALYGQTLASDRDYKLEDLRSYNANVMEVELEFSVEGRRFSVARRIGKNHTVKLVAPKPDGEAESISIRSEVSRRILEELRLTPDALLNTCFVEQKRLERLEDLNAEARRNTINELLNLRVLTQLDSEFRITRDDREALQRLKGRLEIARLDAELPSLEAAAHHARQCLRLVQLTELSRRCRDWQAEVEAAVLQQGAIAQQRENIAQKLCQVAELKARLDAMEKELALHVRSWQDAIAALGRAAARVRQLEELSESLPRREQQLRDGLTLQQQLSCLEELEARRDHLDGALQQVQASIALRDETAHQWQHGAAEQASLAEARHSRQRALDEAESHLQSYRTSRHRADQLKLLRQHLKVHDNVAREAEHIRQRLAGVQANAQQLLAEQQLLADAFREVESLRRALSEHGLDCDLISIQGALQALQDRLAASQAEAGDSGDLEAGFARKIDQTQRERGHVTTLLRDLGMADNAAEDWEAIVTAEQRSVEVRLEARSEAQLQDEVVRARVALREMEDRLVRLEQEQSRRQATLDAQPRANLTAQLQEIETALAHNAAARNAFSQIRAAVAGCGFAATATELQTQMEVLDSQLQHDRKTVGEIADARLEVEARAQTVTTRFAEYQKAWRALLQEEAPTMPAAALQRLPHLQETTAAALRALDEPSLRARDKRLQHEHDALNELVIRRRHQREEAQRQRAVLALELGLEVQADAGPVAAEHPELMHCDRQYDEAGWQVALAHRQEAVRDNRSQRRAAAQAMGLDDDQLDLGEAERAVAEAEKSIAVKRKAGEIVTRARHSIVSRVMPLTMQNMRQLLPLLTAGRYQDVLWDEGNNYLAVYDSRARAYHRKRVFSGGARDQISLALRLAFALATLPGEHNIRPGWLFLDEPLSSFDRNRTQALVDLLTRGLVRRHFSQIFLVSHSESFDPRHFDYRLRLENGCIVENTLP